MSTLKCLMIVLVCGLAALSLRAAETQPASETASPAVLLEKGIYTEETVGDLDAAIKIYQDIVDQAKTNRNFAAQAQYRLAMCYLKKNQNAQAAKSFNELVTAYADQTELVAQARTQIAKARDDMSEAEIAKIVNGVVTDISTMTEADARIPGLFQSLRELKESAVLKELTQYFDSDKNTVRRAAIFVLWKAGFSDASSAGPGLIKLCAHEEDMTRGMAALALGGLKVGSAYATLVDMTLNDKSGMPRRCAAYALGLMGKQEAKATLEKALKDPDAMVRNNAEAALTMLAKANGAGAASPHIIKTSPAEFANDVDPKTTNLSVTFDQKMMGGMSWVQRYPDKYPKMVGARFDEGRTTCSTLVALEPGKVYWIEFNTPPYHSFRSETGQTAAQHALVFATRSPDGKPTPLPEDLVKQAKEINAAVTSDLPRLPGEVISYIIAEHLKATGTAVEKKLAVNTRILGVDEEMRLYSGGLLPYRNMSDQPQAGPISLGNFGREKPDFVLMDESQQPQEFEFRENPDERLGKWALWWKPRQPVPAGAAILLGYIGKNVQALSQENGLAELTINNTFGAPVLESFFLALPTSVPIVNSSEESTSRKTIGSYDVYLWQKEEPTGATHEVKVNLQAPPPGAATKPTAADRKAAEDLSVAGWQLWQQRKLVEAEEKFKAAVEKDPTNANAWNGLGWAQMNQGKPANAKEAFAKAVAIEPKQFAALNGLGWIAKGEGKTDEAMEHWKKAVAVAPAAVAAWNGLATTYMEMGQYDKAIEAYQKWLKFEPKIADAQAGLAKAVAAKKAVAEAMPMAEAWLRLVDESKLTESWDQASKSFQAEISKDKWSADVKSARDPLGKFQSRKLTSATYATSVPGAPDGQYVVVQFETVFDNKKEAIETVTPMLDKDGKWRVSGYYVR